MGQPEWSILGAGAGLDEGRITAVPQRHILDSRRQSLPPSKRESIMIEENRRLTFSMDELATAVLSYLINTKKMGEKDKLAKIAVNESGDVAVAVTVACTTFATAPRLNA